MKRPALYILVPFSAGMAAGSIMNLPVLSVILITAIFAGTSLLCMKNRIASHAALYAAIFFCGIAAYSHASSLPKEHIANLISEKNIDAVVTGVIADDPVTVRTVYKTYKTTFILDAGSLKAGPSIRKVTGFVKTDIFSKAPQNLHYGDAITIEGNISKPQGLNNPGLFDYAKYLRIKGIYARLTAKNGDSYHLVKTTVQGQSSFFKKTAFRFRNKLKSAIGEYFKMPYSGFLKAIIVGDRSALDENIKDDFVKTGTVHVIAISGLNVGLIAAIFLAFFRLLRVPRRINLAVTALGLIFYSVVAGSDPPIVRAVIMFCVYAVGHIIKRDADILNSLSIAALAILLWNPQALYDPSFQLSFIALGSTIVFTSLVNGLLKKRDKARESFALKVRRYFFDGVSASVASWIGSAPIIAAYFNIISPVSIIANFIAIPILFLLTAGSFIFFALSLTLPVLALILAHGMQFVMQAMFSANSILAGIPLAYFRVGAPSAAFIILYYALVLAPLAGAEFKIGKFTLRRGAVAIAILVTFNALVWRDVLSEIKPRGLEATFLDVGQGDCAFLRLPGKTNILIDGGSGGEGGKFDIGGSVAAPFLWNRGLRSIDAVIVTHLHSDHLGGLIYVLKNFKVGCVIDSGAAAETDEGGIYEEYIRTIKEKRIKRIVAREGGMVVSSGNPDIYVLNPEGGRETADSNDNSLVFKMAYNDVKFLFCGDIKDRAISRLNSYGDFLKSDIVKVPHHGGRLGNFSVVKNFFGEISPELSVISVGMRNVYGMPSEETLEIIRSTGSEILDTSKNGAIKISVGPHAKGYTAKITKEN